MAYRTRTYIAGDWTGDKDAIDQLYKWNDSNYWSLHFIDAHDLTQARDGSLNCSIKSSLQKRLDISKCFVLIVGAQTSTLRAGGCQYCASYKGSDASCKRGYSVDYRSYIEYECEQAVAARIKIVVLYNYARVYKDKCPIAVRDKGQHVAMRTYVDGVYHFDYQAVKIALDV